MKHHCKYVSKRLALLLMVLFVGTFTLTGCGSGGGSDSYSAPSGPSTIGGGNVISVETLKAAMDAGKVNSASYDNWVIIQRDMKDGKRILGAQEWKLNGIDRIDGPILSGNMVLDGETMDTMMQERGVRKGSTIVFCGSETSQASRVYFFFRYWGFPKERLVFLDGGFPAWLGANAADPEGYPVTSIPTTVESTTISVADFGGINEEVRASLSEAITGVEEGILQPYSTLPNTATQAPTTTETLDGNGENPDLGAGNGGYVLFQGELRGNLANDLAGQSLLQAPVDVNGVEVKYFLTAEQMRDYLTGLNFDLSKPIMTYCRAGNYASYAFGPIDAVLGNEGVKVMLYDGSYSQWGSLSAKVLANTYVPYDSVSNTYTGDPKQLPYLLPNRNDKEYYDFSKWATDVITDKLFYLVDYQNLAWKDKDGDKVLDAFDPAKDIQKPYFFAAPESPYFHGANTIEDADSEYARNGGAATSAPGAVSGASGGC